MRHSDLGEILAIGFASARYLKRREGRSAIGRLAYIGRQALVSARTGRFHDYSDRGDLETGPVTLLPPGSPPELSLSAALWSAVEAAATHKFAVLGLDLVLALPAPGEMDPDLAHLLVEAFLTAVIIPHGLGATYAIHQPHTNVSSDELAEDLLLDTTAEPDDPFEEAMRVGGMHRHAHVMITPRQVGQLGLARKRYVALDPTLHNRVVVDALNWGRLWAQKQDIFFAEYGLDLRVRPRAPFSAPRAPIAVVRGQRRALLEANPDLAGRALLVRPDLELKNTESLREIDPALQTLTRPFTRDELLSLVQRFTGVEEGRELTDAAVGLAGVVQLGDGSYHGGRWYATVGLAIAELRVIGSAAALAVRSRGAPSLADLESGYPKETKALLAAIAAGPNLVVIDAYNDPTSILEDVARLAEQMDRRPVSLAHGSGSIHPQAIIVGVSKLASKPVTDAIMLVDQTDAVSAHDLDLIFQTALAGKCQVVLVRRPMGIWPKSRLLDLLARRALRLAWGAPPPPRLSDLLRRGEIATAVDQLQGAGRIIHGRGQAILDAGVRWAETRERERQSATILAVDEALVEELNQRLQLAGLATRAVRQLPAMPAEAVLAVVSRSATHGPMLAAQLARAQDLTLLLDRDAIHADKDLVRQLELDMPVLTAVMYGVAGWQLPKSATRPHADNDLPRFAVDWDGNPILDRAGIRDSIAFWSSAPVELQWAEDFGLSNSKVLSALSDALPFFAREGEFLSTEYKTAEELDPVAFGQDFDVEDDIGPDEPPAARIANREDDVGPDQPEYAYPDEDDEQDWDEDWSEPDAPTPEEPDEGY